MPIDDDRSGGVGTLSTRASINLLAFLMPLLAVWEMWRDRTVPERSGVE